MQGELADLKASNAAKVAAQTQARSAVNVEEETRKMEKELKTYQDSLKSDSSDLKSLQAELEALRDVIRKAIAVTGSEIIRGMDDPRGGKAAAARASSRSDLSALGSTREADRGLARGSSAARFKNL